MPISEALKKLYKTITGKDSTGETIEEVVSELNESYPNDAVIEVSIDGTDVTILSHTAEEIAAAWEANRRVFIRSDGAELDLRDCTYTDSENYRFKFISYNYSVTTDKLQVAVLEFSDSLEATLALKTFTPDA